MPTIIPQRVKIIREARHITQARLLRKAKDVSRRTLQRIESHKADRYEIREATLIELAAKLTVEPKVLTGELRMPDEITNPQKSEVKVSAAFSEDIETYETRLVKIDDGHIIVEFTKSDPTGRVIARGIPDESAGLRLTSSHEMKSLLAKAHQHLRGIFNGDIEDSFETEDEYISFLAKIELQLRGPKTHSEKFENDGKISESPAKSEPAIGDVPNE